MFRTLLVAKEVNTNHYWTEAHLKLVKDDSIVVVPCSSSENGYLYFEYEGQIYRPYSPHPGRQRCFFLRNIPAEEHPHYGEIGVMDDSGATLTWPRGENNVVGGFPTIAHRDFNINSFKLRPQHDMEETLSSQGPLEGTVSFQHVIEQIEKKPLLPKVPPSENNSWFRFIATIKTHPFRTLIGVALVAVFLSALLINTLFLPPFLQPLAYLLQNFAASLGTGGIISLAIGGSLALLTAPKWVGNILQFIGDKIIGGLINRLLFIGYGIVMASTSPRMFDLIYLTKSTKNSPLNIIDFNFKPDVTLGYLFWIPLTLIRIPIYLTHWIGKGLDRLGMLIAGEFKLTESDNAAVENRQSIDESVAGEDTLSILERIEQSIASLPDKIDDMITSQVSFPPNSYETLKVDPAIFGPKERELIASTYVDFMDWLKKSPITSTSLEEQLERRKAFVPPAPRPR